VLEAHVKNKDVIIAGQAQLLSQLRNDLEEVKQQTATQSSALAQIGLKDTIIAQQTEALETLQRAVLEVKTEIQRLEVSYCAIFTGLPTHSSGQQGIRDTGIESQL